MRRHIIGALGIVGVSIALYFLITLGYEDGLQDVYASFSLRMGIVMLAIWLGMPDLDRLFAKYPPWVFAIAILAVIFVVRSPRFFPLVITMVGIAIAFQFVIRFFVPKKEQRKNRP